MLADVFSVYAAVGLFEIMRSTLRYLLLCRIIIIAHYIFVNSVEVYVASA